jgi:hypothetical protein
MYLCMYVRTCACIGPIYSCICKVKRHSHSHSHSISDKNCSSQWNRPFFCFSLNLYRATKFPIVLLCCVVLCCCCCVVLCCCFCRFMLRCVALLCVSLCCVALYCVVSTAQGTTDSTRQCLFPFCCSQWASYSKTSLKMNEVPEFALNTHSISWGLFASSSRAAEGQDR